jgi:DNA-binding MarR family transcriptional regulator
MLEVHERLTAHMDAQLRAEHGLPLQWYDVLVQLTEAGQPLRMRDLAERTLFSRTECTRVVARMETAGLVAKRRDPEDGRGVYAEPTVAGKKALREASRSHLADIDRWFTSRLDERETTVIADALWRVATAARAEESLAEPSNSNA